MFRTISSLLILIALAFPLSAQNLLPKVVKGKIVRIENFQSRYVTPRNIDIWLPEGYSDSVSYSALYMQDGQMLFDGEQSWNKQAWDIDDIATKLFDSNTIREFIVIGIWNGSATRHSDYFPQKPFNKLSETEKDTVIAQLLKAGRIKDTFEPQADLYLKFLVEELKPIIDNTYSVKTNRANTFIAGSSMGGLISIYALCEYPEIFGGSIGLSTHWVGTFTLENNPIPNAFIQYLSTNLPNPANHKIYFDTDDMTLDALYPEIQQQIDQLMITKGYNKTNWITNYFPGENHSENSWKKRFHIPLKFIFKK